MKICICDDEKIISEELKNIIEDISFEIDEDIIINQFYSGKELIDNISNKNEKYDIIFLDILMSNLNGIETSKYIRKIDNSVNIVFLTSSSEFAINGYEVGALDYLLKPVDYKKIKKTIDKILANRELEDVFIFKSNNEIIKLPIKFINYFEVKNRIIYINSCSKIYNNKSFYQKLDNIEKELNNKGFVRCHRSFLINIENIIDISSTEVTFFDNIKVPISRRKYKYVKNKFLNYLSESI